MARTFLALPGRQAQGFRHILVAHARGHRFIGNGLGPDSDGVRIEV